MKNVIIILFFAIAIMLGGCNSSSSKNEQTNSTNESTTFQAIDTTILAKGATFYQCPMHLDQVSDKAGSCPVCGMDLEKVVKQ